MTAKLQIAATFLAIFLAAEALMMCLAPATQDTYLNLVTWGFSTAGVLVVTALIFTNQKVVIALCALTTAVAVQLTFAGLCCGISAHTQLSTKEGERPESNTEHAPKPDEVDTQKLHIPLGSNGQPGHKGLSVSILPESNAELKLRVTFHGDGGAIEISFAGIWSFVFDTSGSCIQIKKGSATLKLQPVDLASKVELAVTISVIYSEDRRSTRLSAILAGGGECTTTTKSQHRNAPWPLTATAYRADATICEMSVDVK